MKFTRRLAAALFAVALALAGCSRSPEAQAISSESQPKEADLPPIERYRTTLASVSAAQRALALETAMFAADNWSSVASRALGQASRLQDSIERLMEFDEAIAAAATLQSHVASLQRHLEGIDAANWQSVLPDLLLLNESIQSDMDELADLAAPVPEEMPGHDHDHHGE